MPSLQYGRTIIDWQFQPDARLKRHYVTVERGMPVLLRGPMVGAVEQEALVRQRARWIRDKLTQVGVTLTSDAIVTGSRLRYSGRSYFTEVRHTPRASKPSLKFTASRFIIENPSGTSMPPDMVMPLLELFYRDRANEKLLPRVRYWERQTGLEAVGARIRHFQSRWASCDSHNVVEFHPRVMELAASVQDYVILHELCHTVEKNHTKAFWSLLARHMPEWQRYHAVLEFAAFGAEF